VIDASGTPKKNIVEGIEKKDQRWWGKSKKEINQNIT